MTSNRSTMLEKTRLADSGSIREANYTFFWQGLPQDDPRQHGVGFAVRNSLIPAIEPSTGGSERILTLRLSTSTGFVNVLCIYAPTLCATPEVRDQFYEALDETISRNPNTEGLCLRGDFNARVGADCDSWPSCLGRQDRGKMNENGQRLLELCCHHGLCVTNTFFKCKGRHKLDLVITRRADLRNVLHTRRFHSADCDTDYSLVGCKVRLTAKKILRSKKKGLPRINTCRFNDPESSRCFQTTFSAKVDTSSFSATDIDNRWHHLRDAIYTSALTAFRKKGRRNADWYETHWDEMQPASEAKNQVLLAYKQNSCASTRNALNTACSKAQQTERRCASVYWLNLCSRIQTAVDSGTAVGMYAGIKTGTCAIPIKTAPLKSRAGEVIIDQGKQLECWLEHYLELYATQNEVTDAALDDSLPIMEELDNPPSAEELGKAIDCLSCWRGAGRDGIPSEVLKSGKPALLRPLHELLCLCWEKDHVTRDMRNANIVILYKNKGDRSDCNNYCGISLLSVVGKVFARVVLRRVQSLASRVYPDLRLGQQKRTLQPPGEEGRMPPPPKTAPDGQVLPRGHAQHSLLQRRSIRRLPCEQRRKSVSSR
ncbi:unnamed protein product [Acanthosepion pharaonis]|uniref:Uncharacterized protein n=1 Tax=Acanthosepion pharaonis TaxID=158019 RepID=A0A812ERG0_ACAPH|nr:unnamed protein product [Sepia pharaonis]